MPMGRGESWGPAFRSKDIHLGKTKLLQRSRRGHRETGPACARAPTGVWRAAAVGCLPPASQTLCLPHPTQAPSPPPQGAGGARATGPGQSGQLLFRKSPSATVVRPLLCPLGGSQGTLCWGRGLGVCLKLKPRSIAERTVQVPNAVMAVPPLGNRAASQTAPCLPAVCFWAGDWVSLSLGSVVYKVGWTWPLLLSEL